MDVYSEWVDACNDIAASGGSAAADLEAKRTAARARALMDPAERADAEAADLMDDTRDRARFVDDEEEEDDVDDDY